MDDCTNRVTTRIRSPRVIYSSMFLLKSENIVAAVPKTKVLVLDSRLFVVDVNCYGKEIKAMILIQKNPAGYRPLVLF
jgi:hypothetical protein